MIFAAILIINLMLVVSILLRLARNRKVASFKLQIFEEV